MENRTKIPSASMRRVEVMAYRIYEGIDAIAGESVQLQNLNEGKFCPGLA